MVLLYMNSLRGYNVQADGRHDMTQRGTYGFSKTGAGNGSVAEPYFEIGGNSEEIGCHFGIANSDGPKTLNMGMWVWIQQTDETHEFVRFLDTGAVRQGGFFTTIGGGIAAIRSNSTTVVLETNVIQPGVWNFWETHYRVDNTTGNYIVRINGEEVLRSTGVDSQGTALPRTRQVLFDNESGQNTRLSHLWMWDDTGSVNNTFPLGPKKILHLYPSGSGGFAEWTRSTAGSTNWELVIDDPISNTKFVSSDSTGTTDRYTMDNLPASPAVVSIAGVKIIWGMQTSDINGNMVEGFIESTGTEGTGRARYCSPSGNTFAGEIYDTDPATGSLWTESAINAARIGARIVASTN